VSGFGNDAVVLWLSLGLWRSLASGRGVLGEKAKGGRDRRCVYIDSTVYQGVVKLSVFQQHPALVSRFSPLSLHVYILSPNFAITNQTSLL
jgi:hypothetical protein